MSCHDLQPFIEGYLDGELDLVKSVEVETHLKDCPACSTEYKDHQELRSMIKSGSLYFSAPSALRQRIQSAASAESPSKPIFSWILNWPATLRWAGFAASLVLVALVTWNVAPHFSRRSADEVIVGEILDSHVRSLMVNHLTDVPSSDQHTVKPWFNGKLDFSPTVVNLTELGFPLVGGRLDYIGGKPAAALVYQRRQHLINLFIWPSPEDSSGSLKRLSRHGYNLIHWVQSGMSYWAVSDVNGEDLGRFVEASRKQSP